MALKSSDHHHRLVSTGFPMLAIVEKVGFIRGISPGCQFEPPWFLEVKSGGSNNITAFFRKKFQ